MHERSASSQSCGGTSRSSTEQRPTEQSWSTGKRQRQPEHSSSSGYKARKPGSSRPEDAGAGREQGPGSLQPRQSHDQQQDPLLQWSRCHRKCQVLARREGWLHCLLSPAVTSARHPWRPAELSTVPRALSGHHHLHVGSSLSTGKEGSRSACPVPCAPAANLGQPTLHSKGFPVTPDHSGVLSRRRILGSPSGCCGGVWSKEVLGSAELQQLVWRWP